MTANLLLFAAFVASMLLMSVNHKRRQKKVVFLGDTINGEKSAGFIKHLQQLLLHSDKHFELIDAGVRGDQVYDLYLRLDEDVLAKGADLVVIFVGLHDVSDKFLTRTGTDIKRFEAFYIAIIEKLLQAGVKPILCIPVIMVDAVTVAGEVEEELELYLKVIRALASEYELPLADISHAFNTYLTPNSLGGEQTDLRFELPGVITANELIAREIWKALTETML